LPEHFAGTFCRNICREARPVTLPEHFAGTLEDTLSDIIFHTHVNNLTEAEQAWWRGTLAPTPRLPDWLAENGEYPTVYGEVENDTVHLYSDENDPAELDVVAQVVQDFILVFRPAATIRFGYARVCEPNEGESGGGVIIVNAGHITWRSTDEWLEAA